MPHKTYSKKKFSIATILLAVFISLISPATVQATSSPLAQMPTKSSYVLHHAVDAKGYDFCTPQYKSQIKISVRSSNTNVATVKGHRHSVKNYREKGNLYYAGYEVIPVSPGTTKIYVKVTIGKKSYSKTCSYTVYKWQNPFKALKIGSVNYQSKLNKGGAVLTNKKFFSGKFYYRLNSDFTLESASAYYYTDPQKTYLMKTQKLKNGQTLPKNTYNIWIRAKSKKNHQLYNIVFFTKR